MNMHLIRTESGLSISVAGVTLTMRLDPVTKSATLEKSGEGEPGKATLAAVEVASSFLLARTRRFLGREWHISDGSLPTKVVGRLSPTYGEGGQ